MDGGGFLGSRALHARPARTGIGAA
eukprot:COSAG01_NODE_52539_length_346_cov_0.619433_1_plen_24_part_10